MEKKEIVRTLKLKKPVPFGSESIASLEFIEPKAKHFKKMPAEIAMGEILELASRLVGLPMAVIDELCVEDMMAVSKVVSDFLPVSQETGSMR